MKRRTGRAIVAIAATCVGAACEASPTSSVASPPAPRPTVATSPTPVTSTSAPASSAPTSPSPAPSLPAGIPPAFEDDVAAANVPAAALIPLRAEVTGTWFGAIGDGEAIVVAWQMPGDDPFRVARGVAAWRRFDDGGPPWRPVWGEAFSARARVLAIDAITGDVTGDADDEAVVFAGTGGSGACGSYTVVDLATGGASYERPDLCDAQLVPDPSIPGLVLTEAVYEAGDAHCCPSAFRTTTLTYDGDEWVEADVERTDT